MKFVFATRSKLKEQLVRVVPRDDWIVVGWVFATKVLLFCLSAQSFQILEDQCLAGAFGWLNIWNRWDADQYLRLAEFGYSASSVWKAWLYPFYPWCVRAAAWIIGNYLISALLVSTVALLVGAVLLRRLVQIDFAPQIALWSVWFFLIFPTAYFLHAPYTESLFFALTIASLLAARRGHWWLAGACGALCWMTRANGVIILPCLAVEAVQQFRTTRRWNWNWLWSAIVPAGFGVYLLLNWKVTGDPFAFLHLRKELFFMSASWPWVGIGETIANISEPNATQAAMVGTQELCFTALSLVCAIAAWIRLRPMYAMWITGNWLLIASVTFIEGMPRYALMMFPIFVLFALLARNRVWNAVITLWSLLFLALFTSFFVRGLWAF